MGFLAKLMETHRDSETDYNKFTLLSEDESNDATIADYPVEVGTEGIWTYRKWASGITECWGYKGEELIAMTTKWGNMYYSPQLTESFPTSLFIDYPPFVNVQAYDNGNGSYASIKTWGKNVVSYYAYGVSSQTLNVGFTFEAKGRWK